MRERARKWAWQAGVVCMALLAVVQPALTCSESASQSKPAQQQSSSQPAQQAPAPPKPPAPAETLEPHPAPTTQPGPPAEKSPGTLEGNQVFFEFKYGFNHTGLAGNTDRSFLNPGINHIFDFSSFTNRAWGARRLEAFSVFRYTDDPRVDPERNSLQRAHLRLTAPTFEAALGDHLVSYSRFTFNQNVKGLNLRKDVPWFGGVRLLATGGVFTDRWGALFRDHSAFADPRRPPDPRFPAKPYTRVALGLRGEHKPTENSTLALSYSQGSDVIRSLPPETQISPLNNQVVGLDSSIVFGRNFRLAGEVVYSLTQFDARYQPEKRKGSAVRAELSHRWNRLSWRAEYALFMPNFFSANARQVQDLQDMSVRGTFDLSKRISLQAALRRTNDNLPGRPVLAFAPDPATGEVKPRLLTNPGRAIICPATGSGQGSSFCQAQGTLLQETMFIFRRLVDPAGRVMTTLVWLPETRLTLRQLPRLGKLQVDLGYRERAVKTSNLGSFEATIQTLPGSPTPVPVTTPLFRYRITRIPFLDVSLPMTTGVLNFGYEYRRNRDRVRRDLSTFTHRAVAGYSGSWYLGSWQLFPRLRYEAERVSKQLSWEPVDDPSTPDRLRNPFTNEPLVSTFSGGDLTRSLQGSLGVEFPKYLTLEMSYRELSGEILTGFASGVFFPAPGGGFSQFTFGPGGYRRPSFRGQLTCRIRNDENRFLTFIFERAVNTFAVPNAAEPDTRSFRENVAQLSFVWRVGRR